MRPYPLIPVGLCFAAGIAVGGRWEPALPVLLAALCAVSLAALLHERWRAGWAGLALLLGGWTHVTGHNHRFSPFDLRSVVGEETLPVTVWGVIEQAPSFRAVEARHGREVFSSAIVRVRALQRERGEPEPAAGRLLATVPEALGPEFSEGVPVCLRGVLQPPTGPSAPGLFDYRLHLRQRGIYHLLRTRGVEDWTLENPANGPPPLPARFQSWARQALARGLPEGDVAVELLWAMLLGWKTGLTDEVAAPFMKSGTMHLFAISGLHIGMLTVALLMLLRLAGLSRVAARLLILPLLWFNIAATGWQASAVRAGVMLTVLLGGGILQRPANPLNSLFAAGLLILLWEPRQLFQAGFQLSFLVVLSILVWHPIGTAWLEPLWQRDPLAVGEEPWWRRCLRAGARRLGQGVTASTAAWLGSLPLIAWYFSWVTPVCVAANLLVVPLSGLVVAAGLGAFLTHPWWPALGELFNHSAWFLMQGLMAASEAFAQWPDGHWAVERPPAWFLAGYYALWLLAALPPAAGWWRRGLLGGWAALSVGWLVLAPAWHPPAVTVLPLEDGHAVVMRQGRSFWLVDCGRPLPAQRQVIPFLQAQGANRLEGLFLTHGDLGQVGGVELVQEALTPRQLYYGPLPFRSPFYRSWLERHAGLPQSRMVQAGDTLGRWTVLHPATNDLVNAADDGAMVLRLDLPGGRALLLSDLSRAGQNRLAQRWPAEELRAEVLLCGLPENSEPLADGLLRLVQPRLVIVTDSLYPADRRAPRRFEIRLARQGVAVWCTRLTGVVTVEFSGTGWRARAMDGRWAGREDLHGWHPPPAAPEDEE